jgi:tRNA nucleotidyltransferase (CCA-adding enzyme)
VAGGFIRDKLMGLESHDIDIAINNMSGMDFASLISNHVTKIEARPDQSKHLETAIVEVMGFSIDCVHLRKETYTESRIPTVEPGTPEEDARRRDLTINALFYNLNTGQVEDFTGMGLYDLEHKIARTPIDPIQTFIDDPLRILRTIRFVCKYDLDLDEPLIIAAQDPMVHEAFKTKISKERIWAELIGQEEKDGWKTGSLIGKDPLRAIKLIHQFGLRDILFVPEDEVLNPWDSDQCSIHHDLNIWEHTIFAFEYLLANKTTPINNAEEDIICNLSMLFHDIGKCMPKFIQKHPDGIHLQYKEHEIGSADLTDKALEKLNAPINIKERVVRLVRQHMRLHNLEDNPSDKSLRRFIKDLGEDWRHSVNIAIADANGKLSAKTNPQSELDISERYRVFEARIRNLLTQQQGETKIKRPVNGYDLMNILGFKPGPSMGKAFDSLDEQLLEDPNMNKEKALEFIRCLGLV